MSARAVRRATSSLPFRRHTTLPARLARLYASSSSADTSAAPSTPTNPTNPQDHPTYSRPLPPGQSEIYDLSLSLLLADKAAKLAELSALQAQLASLSGEEAAQAKERVKVLEVEAWINDPEVRWKHKNGLGDLREPVFRHLREKQWRNEGALDLVMESIWQMSVIPDLLPWLDPTLDIRLRFPGPSTPEAEHFRTSGLGVRVKGKDEAKWVEGDVKPGTWVLPAQSEKEPEVYVTCFHPETKYYTLLLIDPDVPSPATQSYTTLLHWLIPNIPLSCSLSPSLPLQLPTPLLPYLPPHPQEGTPYHRYSLFLLPQPGVISEMKTPLRRSFDLREFIRTYSLQGSPVLGAPKPQLPGHGRKRLHLGTQTQFDTGAEVGGGGVHMWRAVWDPSVSEVFGRAFGEGVGERRYGRVKGGDRFADEEGRKVRRYY